MTQTTILVIGGIFWILTYIFIISKDYKDKTYGMPLIALSANISWEVIFSFIFPPLPPQNFINYLWFGLDVIIVSQFLKYAKNEFVNISLFKLYYIFIFTTVTAFIVILIGSITLKDFTGVYSAFGQNLLMSLLFILMFSKRNDLKGQSFSIALFKMLGTGLISTYFYFYGTMPQGPSFILPSIFVSIFLVDLVYFLLVANRYKKNHISILKI